MISLRKSLDRIEECERGFQAALECYLSAITSVEHHLVPVKDDLVYRYRIQLRSLRRKLRGKPVAEVLRESRLDLDRELRDYRDEASDFLEQKDREIKKIIEILAEAAASLTADNQAHDNHLKGFTRELDEIVHLNELPVIRHRLSEQVRGLKCYADEVRRKNEASVNNLRSELKGVRHRLERAEALACTDPLTKVANRVEGEKKLAENIRSGNACCILLFDLDNFKISNDRFGHQAGDEVLKAFAKRLAQSVRPLDTVCRWGGDEFLVILPACGLRDATNRARELADKCAEEYCIALDGRHLKINVHASCGVAEHKRGESKQELFARADKLLYHQKRLVAAR